jgi:hypothetical protein
LLYANSPDDPELRQELAENIYEEETGRLSGVARCHMDVFCDLLAAFGLSRDDADRISLPFDRPTAHGREIASEDFFIELSAYGLSVEAPNAEFCARLHAALLNRYGFSETELTCSRCTLCSTVTTARSFGSTSAEQPSNAMDSSASGARRVSYLVG